MAATRSPRSGERCAEKSHVKGVDEKEVQASVDRRRDEQHIGARPHDLLSLEILLQAFEVDVAETTREQDSEEFGAIACDEFLLAECAKYRPSKQPKDRDWHVEQAQNNESSL